MQYFAVTLGEVPSHTLFAYDNQVTFTGETIADCRVERREKFACLRFTLRVLANMM